MNRYTQSKHATHILKFSYRAPRSSNHRWSHRRATVNDRVLKYDTTERLGYMRESFLEWSSERCSRLLQKLIKLSSSSTSLSNMSRSVRAETRQRAKDEKKHHISNLFSARKWWGQLCMGNFCLFSIYSSRRKKIYFLLPFQGEEMGHDLWYHDEDLQMGSGELQWERAEQEA